MKDWKKALGIPLLSAGLVFSAFAPALTASAKTDTSSSKARSHVVSQSGGNQGSAVENTAPVINPPHSEGPFDAGLVNDDILLKTLIKQGKIDKNWSVKRQREALRDYVTKRAEASEKMAKNSDQDLKKTRSTMQKKAGLKVKPPSQKNAVKAAANQQNKVTSGKGQVKPIEKEGWNGPVRHDKILVLLIDFPDRKHGEITSDENPVLNYGDNYDFPKEHYQNMLFGKEGYSGPSGQKLISMKQFYEQQSGGSYTVDGEVFGWYTAKHNAAYYGAHSQSGGNDANPRALVQEALEAAANEGVDLSQFDQENPYDLLGDGNLRQPDGIIDHLMVIHAGTGEEAGGGHLGDDAIWSHSWNLGSVTPIPGSHSTVPYWGGQMAGYAYTIQPEDGAAGVFSHEYGHNLGLPDEYDTAYSTEYNEPVGYWSIMSSGSWGGKIAGTEPTGFSAYDKEYLQSTMPELNWFKNAKYDLNDLLHHGTNLLLDEASVKGTNPDALRIDLPDKATKVNTPKSGTHEYWGGKGNEADHKLVSKSIDLTNTSTASLDFDTWYNMEKGWDFAMVQVSEDDGKTWQSLSTKQTTDVIDPDGYPDIKANLPGYTGSSGGWIHQTIDLKDYVGKTIKVQFRQMTDWATNLDGFYVDNIKVTADGHAVIDDGAESGQSDFTLDGFAKSDGNTYTKHYYLMEWRNWEAADEALAHIARGASLMTYDPGLVVWYVDNKYEDNIELNHPGHGFLNVVDAHQRIAQWSDYTIASNPYQIQDAAFSLNKTDDMFLDYRDINGRYLKLNGQKAEPLFDDSKKYYQSGLPYIGVDIPKYGLKVQVTGQAKDMTVGRLFIGDDTVAPKIELKGDSEMTWPFGKEWIDPGYKATDNVDGNLTKQVKVTGEVDVNKLGTYTLTYSVSDSSGNKAEEVTRTVKVIDQDAPTITLKGDNPLTLKVGQKYKEPGYQATDNVDGNLTKAVKVDTSKLNVKKVGKYTVTYTVSDKSGNQAIAKRTVNVVKKGHSGGGHGGSDHGNQPPIIGGGLLNWISDLFSSINGWLTHLFG
ncbi:immune inhibitor A domain-containing protein [Camelliibacillus cellulosilyticus]|uniref:Immune inhibitor A domain-containing protein n=1 Tax=Camelliibacillus cellulosilyticus TaxID=2174486 RepID=A0ABV9GPT7_9BACL